MGGKTVFLTANQCFRMGERCKENKFIWCQSLRRKRRYLPRAWIAEIDIDGLYKRYSLLKLNYVTRIRLLRLIVGQVDWIFSLLLMLKDVHRDCFDSRSWKVIPLAPSDDSSENVLNHLIHYSTVSSVVSRNNDSQTQLKSSSSRRILFHILFKSLLQTRSSGYSRLRCYFQRANQNFWADGNWTSLKRASIERDIDFNELWSK